MNLAYRIVHCPDWDWHEVWVSQKGTRCLPTKIFEGHSVGQAYEIITKHAGLDIEDVAEPLSQCD
jgi:hypothetical protein